MSALTRFFFRPTTLAQLSPWATIAWWESRRPAYNIAVGSVGLVTLAAANAISSLPPDANPIPLAANLIAPVVYAVAANACYTLGWGAELLLRKWLGDEVSPAGPAMFRYGFVFSIGLTLLPIAFAGIDWLVRVLRATMASPSPPAPA